MLNSLRELAESDKIVWFNDPNQKFSELAKTRTVAEQFSCGNCGEQSAIAFMFLYEAGFHPLDRMRRTFADHAFVVIGRVKGSNPEDYRTWGESAVVVDPWDKSFYRASDIPSKMYGNPLGIWHPKLFKPIVIHRVD